MAYPTWRPTSASEPERSFTVRWRSGGRAVATGATTDRPRQWLRASQKAALTFDDGRRDIIPL